MTKKRRGRRELPDAERKDRLIQTRVAEDLDEALRDEARKKRVTVSQLIRNVLEDTFTLVDDVVNHSVGLAKTVKRDAQRIASSAKGEPKVYAWQEVVLARDEHCGKCGTLMRKGEQGLLGLQDDPAAPKLWMCSNDGKKLRGS